MLFLKFLLTIGGTGMMLVAAGILTHGLVMEFRYRPAFESDAVPLPAIPRGRWPTAFAFAWLGWAPLVIVLGLAAGGIAESQPDSGEYR
jgi:hypothetical protein